MKLCGTFIYQFLALIAALERGVLACYQIWIVGKCEFLKSLRIPDLAPAKKKLIEINLGKLSSAMRDTLLDLVAKYAAEMSKS